jgi:hypothetical protein
MQTQILFGDDNQKGETRTRAKDKGQEGEGKGGL